MSNDSPSPDAEPTKRSIPSDKSTKDHTELDLWDLDAEAVDDGEAGSPPAELPSRREKESSVKSRVPTKRPSNLPTTRDQSGKPAADPEPAVEDAATTPIPVQSATKGRGKIRKNAPRAAKEEPSDLDELDEPSPHQEAEPEPLVEEKSPARATVAAATAAEPEELSDSTNPSESEVDGTSPSPFGKTFLSSLSKTEKIGIAALVAILALSTVFTLIHFSNRVPTRALIAKPLDLPIRGEWLTATAVSTFWRAPILTGDERDTVRRNTQLIPVVQITLEGKPSAVRVFFRNEDGIVIGDGITRSVGGSGQITIPATAGFDDIGMHAAYRTGESQPWVVQIFEAPGPDAARDQFKKLLETEISTDVR